MRSARIVGRRALPSCALLALALWAEPAGAQLRAVDVGITSTCPYGLEACWAGAYEALMRVEGVESVSKTPNAYNCTARVLMKGSGLPDPDNWAAQFKSMVDQSYEFRGVEVTIEGTVEGDDGGLVLRAPGLERPIALGPLQHKLQWNIKKEAPRQPEPDERDAHQRLAAQVKDAKAEGYRVQVTGPLMKTKQGYALEVREFFSLARDADPRPQG